MSAPAPGTAFLDEFKGFLGFLQSLWGVLAGVSVVFPLSNVLVNVVPLQSIEHDGAFAKLSPSLVTTLATLTTLFVILWTFGHRGDYAGESQRRPIQRKALGSFAIGAAALVIYVVGYYVKMAYAYDVWGWESEVPQHLLAEVPLILAYVAAFTMVTRAFVLLALVEFLGQAGRK